MKYKIPEEYAIRPEENPLPQPKVPLFKNSLAMIALVMVAVWVGFCWFAYQDPLTWMQMFSQTWISMDRPDVLKMLSERHDILVLLVYSLIIVYLFSLIWLRYRFSALSFLHISVLALPVVLLAGLTLPFDSTDYMVYINYGWLQSHYDLNPYVYRVLDVPGHATDPMFRPHWTHMVTVYGPIFLVWMKGLTTLTQGHYLLTMALMKLANVLCHGLIGLMLYACAKRLKLPRPDWILWAYWVNPLMLSHQVAALHNDIGPTFCMVLALFALVFSLVQWVLPCLMVGGLVKLFPAFLLPLFSRWMNQMRLHDGRLRVGLLVACCIVPLSGLFYLDDYPRIPWRQLTDHMTVSYATIYEWAILQVIQVLGLSGESVDWLKTEGYLILLWLGRGFCGVLLLWLMWQINHVTKSVSHAEAFQQLVRASLTLLFAVILLASSRCSAWYFVLLVPLTLLLPMESALMWFMMGFLTVLPLSILDYGNTTSMLIIQALGAGLLSMSILVGMKKFGMNLKRFNVSNQSSEVFRVAKNPA